MIFSSAQELHAMRMDQEDSNSDDDDDEPETEADENALARILRRNLVRGEDPEGFLPSKLLGEILTFERIRNELLSFITQEGEPTDTDRINTAARLIRGAWVKNPSTSLFLASCCLLRNPRRY